MTVANNTNKTRQLGDGFTTVFSFSFPIFEEGDLEVYKIDKTTTPETANLQTISTDYTVDIDLVSEGGDVTFLVAPTSNEDVFIKRVIAFTQNTALPPNITFPEENVENEFDKSRMLDIQVQEETARTVKLNEFSESLVDLSLPDPVASRVIGFDSTGLAMALFSGSDLDTILTSAFGQQLVQSINAETTRDFLELGTSDDVEFNDLTVNDLIVNDLTVIDIELDDLQVNKIFNLQETDATLSGDAFAFTGSNTRLSNEGGAATDFLKNITGGNIGDICIIRPKDSAQDFTIDQTGNLNLRKGASTATTINIDDSIAFQKRHADDWVEIFRSLFNDFMTGSGYHYLPNNRLEQYGIYTGGAHAPLITFPIAFDSVDVVEMIADTAGASNMSYSSLGTTSVIGRQWDQAGGALTNNFSWRVIGKKAL